MSSASGGSWIMARRSDGRSAERLVKRPTKTGPKKNTKQQPKLRLGPKLGGSFLFSEKGGCNISKVIFLNHHFLEIKCFSRVSVSIYSELAVLRRAQV